MKKALKITDIALNSILAILYAYFIYVITTMFSFLPWHDVNDLYLIKMLVIWLPISVVTIFCILIKFINRDIEYSVICLSALNAIYIPLIFGLGFLNISLWLMQLICFFAIITMILYFVIIIKKTIKNR